MDWKNEPEDVMPIPVEVEPPSEEEFKVFEENAGEINYLLEQVYLSGDSGNAGALGRSLGEFASFCFKMGVNYQKGLE